MLWAFMMLALFRFDGDLGGIGFNGGTGASLGVQDGMAGIPPTANDGMAGIPPKGSFKALDGMAGIPPR